jgi:hypothetical protein
MADPKSSKSIRHISQSQAREAIRLLAATASVLGCSRQEDERTCRTAKVRPTDYCMACEASAFVEGLSQ